MNLRIKYGLLMILLMALVFVPEEMLFRQSLSVCVFKNLTGLECPLCGMTRAGYWLVRFQVHQAFLLNPLVLFLPLILMIEILSDFYDKVWVKQVRKGLWVIFVLGLGVLFVFRLC